jgi:voltage-gated potassium channel
VIPVALMLRRLARVFRVAVRDHEFLPVLGAAGILILSGTIAYSVIEGWNVIDGFYFSISTLTTSMVADPELVLTTSWMKVFTPLYMLVGIGVLVELLRRFGMSYVEVFREGHRRHDRDPGEL